MRPEAWLANAMTYKPEIVCSLAHSRTLWLSLGAAPLCCAYASASLQSILIAACCAAALCACSASAAQARTLRLRGGARHAARRRHHRHCAFRVGLEHFATQDVCGRKRKPLRAVLGDSQQSTARRSSPSAGVSDSYTRPRSATAGERLVVPGRQVLSHEVIGSIVSLTTLDCARVGVEKVGSHSPGPWFSVTITEPARCRMHSNAPWAPECCRATRRCRHYSAEVGGWVLVLRFIACSLRMLGPVSSRIVE